MGKLGNHINSRFDSVIKVFLLKRFRGVGIATNLVLADAHHMYSTVISCLLDSAFKPPVRRAGERTLVCKQVNGKRLFLDWRALAFKEKSQKINVIRKTCGTKWFLK
jgi:hypothetical protein